jgi:hypothetical protein
MAKFPYKGFNEKEIRIMESYYCLAVGGDFVINDGCFTYTQKELAKIYNDTLHDLVLLSENGSARDRKYAMDLIGSLRITPFRLQ